MLVNDLDLPHHHVYHRAVFEIHLHQSISCPFFSLMSPFLNLEVLAQKNSNKEFNQLRDSFFVTKTENLGYI